MADLVPAARFSRRRRADHRALDLRSAKGKSSATLLEQVIMVYQRQGVNEEVLQKLAKDSPLGAVLAAGLRNHRSSATS